jgi:hypothetical protein
MTSSNQCAWQEHGRFRLVMIRESCIAALHGRPRRQDRYIFPSMGGDKEALHPLLAWWAILFAPSMLARYQPETGTGYLAVDKSAYAVPLETLMARALLTCPVLLLHAIRSVST